MNVLVEEIQRRVAQAYNLTASDILSPRRDALQARELAMWLARRLCRISYPALGRAFERDHSTVLRAVRQMDRRISEGHLDEILPPNSPVREMVQAARGAAAERRVAPPSGDKTAAP